MDESLSSTVLAFRLDVLCEVKVISFIVDGSWSISDVKSKIHEIEGTAAQQQQLCYEGKVLRNSDCLFDLKHHWDSSTEVVLEMRIVWRLPCASTRERDEARSRSPSREAFARSPVPSDLENENCIFLISK